MTWEELKAKAKEIGYKSFVDYRDIEYLYGSDTNITFYQNGDVTAYGDVEVLLKSGVKYDKMWQIMEVVR